MKWLSKQRSKTRWATIGFLSKGLIVVFFGWFVITGVRDYSIEWENAKVEEVLATLVSSQYSPSTLQSHITPIVSPNGGFHVALNQSGHNESYVTVWSCGKFGTLICNDRKVFQYGTKNSTLLIKTFRDEFCIIGIKH